MRSNTVINIGAPMVLAAALLAPAGVALASTSSVQSDGCSVKAVESANTANQANSRFTISGGVITAKFVVSGAKDCRQPVTITTWQAPNGQQGKPYSEQKLFNHMTATFGPGVHTISTPLPNCYFQVDLLRSSQPTAPDGSPVYPTGWSMGSLHGGNRACVVPTPKPTPLPTPIPTPVVTPVPVPVPTPSVLGTSTQLPDTGSALGGMVGIGSMASAGYAYLRSRRNLRSGLK